MREPFTPADTLLTCDVVTFQIVKELHWPVDQKGLPA